MKLNDVRPARGAVRKRQRLGQGPGSGKGKTAGRGSKGQKSRSGSSSRPGFEGGQMPLQRRIPKRGFWNPFRKEYSVINLTRLGELFDDGTEVSIEMLRDRRLIKPKKDGIKLLGDGEINKRLVVHAHKASASAKRKIEAAGGRVELVAVSPPAEASAAKAAAAGEKAAAAGEAAAGDE